MHTSHSLNQPPAFALQLNGAMLRQTSRAGSRKTTVSDRIAFAPKYDVVGLGHAIIAGVCSANSAIPEDHFGLKRNDKIVATGHFMPSQEAIRSFLRCRKSRIAGLKHECCGRSVSSSCNTDFVSAVDGMISAMANI